MSDAVRVLIVVEVAVGIEVAAPSKVSFAHQIMSMIWPERTVCSTRDAARGHQSASLGSVRREENKAVEHAVHSMEESFQHFFQFGNEE